MSGASLSLPVEPDPVLDVFLIAQVDEHEVPLAAERLDAVGQLGGVPHLHRAAVSGPVQRPRALRARTVPVSLGRILTPDLSSAYFLTVHAP